MSVISDGFKLGNIVLAKKYTMTRTEMETIGEGTGFPDVFPIWCTDDNCLYIFYKTIDGTANIANYNDLIPSESAVCLYPTINPETSEISWEFKTLTDQVPDPVTLQGAPGKSSYQTWLDLGNTGTEQEFIDSLRGNFSDITDADIAVLKTKLGFDTLEATIADINTLLDDINS